MSANSPTYPCEGGGTPLINSTTPYCIVPGGNKRMEVCCNERGNHGVEFEPDCYSWCQVDVDTSGGQEFQLALQTATDKFAYCLSHGANSSTPVGMVCNEGTNFTQPDASATVTSTSSTAGGGMQSTGEAATSGGGGGGGGNGGEAGGASGSASDNRAAPAMQTGNAKAAGLVGGLLLAAGAFGGAI